MLPIPLNNRTRLGFNILILLGVVVALHFGQSVIIPAVIALLLASVLGPAAAWMHQVLKVRWTLACVTVVFALILLNLLITTVFAASVTRMLNALPSASDERAIKELYNRFREPMEDYWPFPIDEELFPRNPQSVNQIQAFQRTVQFVEQNWPRILGVVVGYGGSWFWQWILILFILFFFMVEGRMLIRRGVEIFGPSEEVRAAVGAVLYAIAAQVRTYLVWRTIINFGLALVVGGVYQAFGLSQAWMWAVFLAILNYIPYIGPIIAGVPPVVDAFLSVSPVVALLILILYTVIIVIEGYLIVPVVMGRSMDLNATTVLLACLFWELLWGSLGLFLAMPLMAGLKAVCYHVPEWRPWANLMSTGDEPPQPVRLKTDDDGTNAVDGQMSPPAPDKDEEMAAADGKAPGDTKREGSDMTRK